MRHLIETSNTLGKSNRLSANGRNGGIGLPTTNLIEYYQGSDEHLKEHNESNVNPEKMKRNANDIILDLILLKNKMYMHIISDYELKRCEFIFKEMIAKYNMCHEAYFGLGKIFLCENELESALELLELSLKGPNHDPGYLIWTALTLYYLYKRCTNNALKKQYALKCQKYAIECLNINESDINALFILLVLVIDVNKNYEKLRMIPKFKPEDLATWAKQIDNYKGYQLFASSFI